ncbi:MAG: diguanylate cyclase [Planctomycetota bacterium]|nr:diguanylate cyclase [Planctomycetota bacterium]
MRVLIAEDDPISRRLLRKVLEKWGHEVIVAEDGDKAWDIVQRNDAPNLAILDWMMPGMDGVEICRQARKTKRKEYLYIILLTAKGTKEDFLEGMEAGADDYTVKPLDLGELQVRMRAAERILDLQSELIGAQEALRLQATHDSLTGLLNRAAIRDMFKAELTRAQREDRSVAVIMADLDHFKRINDTYGHAAGDTVLRETAQRMRSTVRSYDAIGRYGGEEFLLLMPGCDLEVGVERAEKIRRRLADEPVKVSGKDITVTLSLGLTAYTSKATADLEEIIRAADEAMYKAKRAGRNQVETLDLAAVAL